MRKIIYIVSIGVILILSACSNKNLMKYYYPINKRAEVKVYKYINPNNKENNEYWMTTTNPKLKTILTESFDSNFNLYNTFEEKVLKDEAILLKYSEYEGEYISKEIKSIVKKNQVYNSSKTKSYNYAVEYTNEYGKFIFEKKRQFIKFEEIEIEGTKYETAKFKDVYFINAIDLNDRYEFNQIAYYAKGIGMVKYERFLPTGETRILELEEILSKDEFQKISKGSNL